MKVSLKILNKYWKHANFRPLQEEIIGSVLAGSDTLALLPTGGGKSVCYQIPAIAMEGMCLVISPLVALMADQVAHLHEKGIPAVAVHSGLHFKEIEQVLNNAIDGRYKFLYLSPERLSSKGFTEILKRLKICLIAVDEAHCISQWGYDFRPHYLNIGKVRELFDSIPIIALTASATVEVREDILKSLLFKNPNCFQSTYARPNISYSVFNVEDKEAKIIEILNKVSGSAIVYARSRKKTQELSLRLYRQGISSDFYHAGLDVNLKEKKQQEWFINHRRVMVCTNAFGMGIDKPDVRVVIHYDVPDCMEAYYQEAGRAGRDGNKSFAVLLYANNDTEQLAMRAEQNFPEVVFIKRVYQALANYFKIAVGSSLFESYDFDIEHFCTTYELKPFDTYQALKRLENEGFIAFNESFFNPSSILIVVDKLVLYDYQLRNRNAEDVVTAILRIYGGDVFSSFVTISESKVAAYLKVSENQVKSVMQSMHKSNVVIYNEKKDKPNVTFLTQRYDANKLPFDQVAYKRLKENFLEKANYQLKYLRETSQCRSMLISGYFSEILEPCGKCDNCLNKKKVDTKLKEALGHKIKTLLESESKSADMIEEALVDYRKPLIKEVLQILVDTEEIKLSNNGRFEMKIKS